MGKYKIAIYAICKNEEKFARRWVQSARAADGIFVLDTGSEDKTVDILRSMGVTVKQKIYSPWRFDIARNESLEMVPKDFDICICLDLDEVLGNNWREILEKNWSEGVTRARYTFAREHNPDGSVKKTHPIEKIHSRNDYIWIHPVHEVLHYIGSGEEKKIFIWDLVVHHFPDPNKPRTQYLPLLELSAQENPDSSSVIFWLGREYMYYGHYDKSIQTLLRHLSLPAATWDEERSASMRFIGYCYAKKGDIEQAKSWYLRAAAECPNVREPYLELCKLAYQKQDWPLCLFAAERASKIIRPSGTYLVENEAWGSAIYDYGSIAAYRMGMYSHSLKLVKIAAALSPEDKRIKENLKLIAEAAHEQV